MATLRRRPLISTPKEHGALVTLVCAGGLAVAVAPQQSVALATLTLFLLAFLARGPIERRVRKFRPRPWDLVATGCYLLAALGAVFAVANSTPGHAAIAVICCVAVLSGGAIAQKLRIHRSLAVELTGMALGGVAAAVAIVAGAGTIGLAAVVAASLISYSTASVLLVRAQLRDLSAGATRTRNLLALAWLAAGMLAANTFGPTLAIAFAPRLAQVTLRCVVPARPTSPYVVAVFETAQLLVFVGALAWLLS